MADWGPVLIGVLLFILLQPGLLFQLPGNQKQLEFGSMNTNGKSIAVHALIFSGYLCGSYSCCSCPHLHKLAHVFPTNGVVCNLKFVHSVTFCLVCSYLIRGCFHVARIFINSNFLSSFLHSSCLTATCHAYRKNLFRMVTSPWMIQIVIIYHLNRITLLEGGSKLLHFLRHILFSTETPYTKNSIATYLVSIRWFWTPAFN